MQSGDSNQLPPGGGARAQPIAGFARVARPVVFAPLLLAASVALCAATWDRGLPPNDEGALLTNAARILRGEVFYRDIDSYPFPASHYLVAGAMAIFGEEVRVARALASLFFVIVVLSLYAAALRVLDFRRAALFGACLLCFKFLAWPAFTAYLYPDVSLAFGSLAVALLLRHAGRGPSAGLALAGGCVAASLAAKQNLGLYLGAAGAALLLWPERLVRAPAPERRWAQLAAFAGGAAAPLLAGLAYFAAKGALGSLLYSGLVRPFTGYLPTSSISFAAPLAWWRLGSFEGVPGFPYFAGPLWALLSRERIPGELLYPAYWLAGEVFTRIAYTAIPLVFAAVFLRWWRAPRHAEPGDVRCFTLALLAGATLLSAFPRADFFHVIGVYPIVLLLLFSLGGSGRFARLEFGLVAIGVALCGVLLALHRASHDVPLELERGRIRVTPEESWVAPVVRFVQDEVPPGERLFVLGNEATFYFLAERFYPWPFSQLYPGQAGGDGGRVLVRQLLREPPAYVLRGVLSWPGLPALPGYAPALVPWVRTHFERDPRVFQRYPVLRGDPPPVGMFAPLRPRAAAAP